MRITEIVRVDSKGRITIPMVIRESLNIVEGMHVVLIADTSKREIIISPVVFPGTKLYEIYIEINDVPGALAEVTDLMAKYGVDLIATHCTTVRRGETAECLLIADMSKSKLEPDALRLELAKLPDVKLVNIRQMQRSI